MDKTKLIPLLNTLNTIEVVGKDNMVKLLGCIQYLEQLINAPEQKPEEES